MSCKERKQLFAYALRQLGPREEREVRAHVGECDQCRASVEEYRQVDAMLDEWKPVEPSPWFDARLRQALARAEVKEPSRVWSWLGWAPRWSPVHLGGLVVLVAAASLTIAHLHTVWRGHEFLGERGASQGLRSEVAQSVSSLPSPKAGEEELNLYENLPVLEDYDMLTNFDLLSELQKGRKKIAH